MPLILPITQPAYYVIKPLGIDGVTPIGQATGVNNALPLIYSEGEGAFLDAAKAIGVYKPLPAAGTWLEAGQMYGYKGGLLIVRQTHIRTEQKPEDAAEQFITYREGQSTLPWAAKEKVDVGTLRTYGGKTWRCLLGHITADDLTPDKTPKLWGMV